MGSFFITIDTEGDNLWSYPDPIETNNLKRLPRFQMLCEKFNFKPIYLTNWECANDEFFVNHFKELQDEKKCEIGMHLHAWNNPPLHKKAKTRNRGPFLIEYDIEVMRRKISTITNILEDKFEKDLVSHRAGRWAINSDYLDFLVKLNYKIDCSYTPYINWSNLSPDYKNAGIDYSHIRNVTYKHNLDDREIKLLPTTIIENPNFLKIRRFLPSPIIFDKLIGKLEPRHIWLRPNGKNLKQMCKLVDYSVSNNFEYIMFILHSSELMEAGSPTFPSKRSINKLYLDLECLFEYINEKYVSETFRDFLTKK
tara:strand:+ start:353 stop:1282 length:930 start_codon:yes stop_codon:yes gene_type:complete